MKRYVSKQTLTNSNDTPQNAVSGEGIKPKEVILSLCISSMLMIR